MQNNNKTSHVNLLFPFFKISRRIYLLWRRVNIFSYIYVKQSMSGQSLVALVIISSVTETKPPEFKLSDQPLNLWAADK
jgi:hypothetical protein